MIRTQSIQAGTPLYLSERPLGLLFGVPQFFTKDPNLHVNTRTKKLYLRRRGPPIFTIRTKESPRSTRYRLQRRAKGTRGMELLHLTSVPLQIITYVVLPAI